MALPTFVNAGAFAAGIPAITPALPASLLTDDILLLFLHTANQAISIPTPNGGTWTEVHNSPIGIGTGATANTVRLTAFWSRYNGTQGAPTTNDSGDHQLGQIVAFRGCRTSSMPYNTSSVSTETIEDTSGSIAGSTISEIDCLVVAAIATNFPDAVGTANFSAWANADLANVTERTDNTSNANNGGGLGIATGEKATVGAYGATTVTLGTSARKAMMTIALRPPNNNVVWDNTTTAAGAAVSSLTFSHTVAGSDRLLIVGTGHSSSTVSDITYAATSMTVVADTDAEGGIRGFMRRLIAPATGANDVVVTTVALDNITAHATSYTGVDQTTPLDTPATAVSTAGSTTPSVAVSSATDDLVIDSVHDAGADTMTVDASQTERGNHRGAGNGAGNAGSEEPGAASVTMSWTKGASGKWGIIGVSVNPAALPPGGATWPGYYGSGGWF